MINIQVKEFYRTEVDMTTAIDIEEIIENENVEIYFQPIVSTYQGKVAGVEALVRGRDYNGNIISPNLLFDAAREENLVVELDRLCQKKACETYKVFFGSDSNVILFINVDNSVIHINAGLIYDYVVENGLSPNNIVLEINELQSQDDNDMIDVKAFTKRYREKGFMISIDDIGSGFSNLDRIIALEPDIIKIDRDLIKDIHDEYFKQQVVDMIIKLADKTGALVVAEGVEELCEILTVLQFGAHLLQGYYISKPMSVDDFDISKLDKRVQYICSEQTEYLSKYLTDKCYDNSRLRNEFYQIKNHMPVCEYDSLEQCLENILRSFTSIECAYVINGDGIQITNTIFNEENQKEKPHKKALFVPYKKGDNAKLKAYYYVLKTTNQDMYLSEEYLSLATGSKCITISGYIEYQGEHHILCLDIAV